MATQAQYEQQYASGYDDEEDQQSIPVHFHAATLAQTLDATAINSHRGRTNIYTSSISDDEQSESDSDGDSDNVRGTGVRGVAGQYAPSVAVQSLTGLTGRAWKSRLDTLASTVRQSQYTRAESVPAAVTHRPVDNDSVGVSVSVSGVRAKTSPMTIKLGTVKTKKSQSAAPTSRATARTVRSAAAVTAKSKKDSAKFAADHNIDNGSLNHATFASDYEGMQQEYRQLLAEKQSLTESIAMLETKLRELTDKLSSDEVKLMELSQSQGYLPVRSDYQRFERIASGQSQKLDLRLASQDLLLTLQLEHQKLRKEKKVKLRRLRRWEANDAKLHGLDAEEKVNATVSDDSENDYDIDNDGIDDEFDSKQNVMPAHKLTIINELRAERNDWLQRIHQLQDDAELARMEQQRVGLEQEAMKLNLKEKLDDSDRLHSYYQQEFSAAQKQLQQLNRANNLLCAKIDAIQIKLASVDAQ